MIKYLIFLTVFIAGALFSKDIDLDKIYINSKSPEYKKIIHKKLHLYTQLKSNIIDNNVIFASWIGGNRIVYIKEVGENCYIFIYNKRKNSKKLIVRIKGVVTAARISADGKIYFIKNFIIKNGKTTGYFISVNLHKGSFIKEKSLSLFLDFTVSPYGSSCLREDRYGISEHFYDIDIKKKVLDKYQYINIKGKNSLTMAFISPNKYNILITNGSGGSYRAKIITNNNSWKIKGISSVSEIFWLNNSKFVFQKGSMGKYSVNIYDINSKKSMRILSKSYNTNINYSKNSGIISFLNNQVVYFYFWKDKKIINTGIEGEDLFFSNDGNFFISLFNRKLLLSNYNNIIKNRLIIQRNAKSLLKIYYKIKKKNKLWNNRFSNEYLLKKIKVYKNYLNQ